MTEPGRSTRINTNAGPASPKQRLCATRRKDGIGCAHGANGYDNIGLLAALGVRRHPQLRLLRKKRMASIFDLFEEIRRRPSMYLGGDESRRVEQLHNLELLVSGYSLALRQHHVQERVHDFNREFGTYLRETEKWSLSCGPVAAICDATPNGEEAWQMFWSLVDDFHATVQ